MDTAAADRPLAGIAYMLLTGLLFVGVIAIVKHLGGALPAAESAFLRYLFGLVFLLPIIGNLRRARLSGRDLGLFGLRGAAHTIAVILWFFAMSRIHMAEVTAMNYMSPVYVTLGAALFLGERLAARRLIAVGAAMLGALVILRPGFRELSSGHIAMLFAAVLFGVSYLTAKMLSGRVSPTVIVGMLSITVTIGLAPFAAAAWVTPSLSQLGWIAAVACFATAGHYTMTLAFQAAPITVTQPVTFLQLVWSVLMGALFFGEPVDGWVVLGGGIIMAAVSFITWREAVLKRRSITPSHMAMKL
jgi:drug/metabolite transporter (DMT)-like permease